MITEDAADYVWRGPGGPILLEQTCGACPEQYDAWTADGIKVGYLRLRHGHFTVEVHEPFGRLVYEAQPRGDGAFAAAEHDNYLTEACRAIAANIICAHDYQRTGEAFMSSPPQYHEVCARCGSGRLAIPSADGGPWTYREARNGRFLPSAPEYRSTRTQGEPDLKENEQ